jgi:hypothetical protein
MYNSRKNINAYKTSVRNSEHEEILEGRQRTELDNIKVDI